MFERNHQLVFFNMERTGIIPRDDARHSRKTVHLHCDRNVTFIIMIRSRNHATLYLLVCYCALLSSHCFYLTLYSSPLPSSGTNEPVCATMPSPASVHAALCVLCVTYSGCWHSLILRENTDAAFCFCPCFTSRLIFISTMVISFSSFYGGCVSLNGRELEGHPLIPGAPETLCHSAHFYRVNLL